MRIILSFIFVIIMLLIVLGFSMARTQWRAQFDFIIAVLLGAAGVCIATWIVYNLAWRN